MNELQMEKLRELAEEDGFEANQDELVEDCEALIEAAEGEDYDDFVDSLADITIAVQQVVSTLPEGQREQYVEAVEAKLKELTGIDDVSDEEDIDPDNEPY